MYQTRKAVIATALIALAGFTSFFAYATERAYLAYDDYECKSDHMVFETSSGYVLAEWYGGVLHSGNFFHADFHGYGFKDVYESQQEAEAEENSRGRIWIDDYMVSDTAAKKWCK